MAAEILFKDESYKIIGACFEKIIVEIKAVKELTDEHRAQVINYLKASEKQLALLINSAISPYWNMNGN
jgi:GxxExxY protein